jgi:chromosome segregation protein
MYLEKLEIQGFKSFANKNTLVFPGMLDQSRRGITAIVGPNGSGKSNVADSVRWALGEQSIKALRGKKSEDVIFSGSDQKGKLGMAEVSLYLNNEDRKAPVDYSQVILTRRLFRNGDSEYLINNSRARLSDIQILLAKASFGQKTYSVIGQGMVEGFLNTSLADRKEFFDEATGVKQFQIKRDDSLNKLANSYDNLHQAQMLLAEIEPRIKSLTRQVNKLKRRGEIEGELKNLQLNYYGKIWHEINDKFNSFNKELLEFEKTKADKEKKLSDLNRELEQMEQESKINADFEAWQNDLIKLRGKKEKISAELAKIEAQLEIKLEASGKFDLSWLNGKKNDLVKEISSAEEEVDMLEKNIANEKTQLAEIEKNRQAINSQIKTLNQNLIKYNASYGGEDFKKIGQKLNGLIGQLEIAEDENDLEKLKNLIRKIKAEIKAIATSPDLPDQKFDLEKIQEELSRLTNEKEDISTKINESSFRISARSERVILLKEKLEKTKLELEQIKNKLQQHENAADVPTTNDKQLRQELTETDTEIKKISEKSNEYTQRENAKRDKLFSRQKTIQTLQMEINNVSNHLHETKINSTRYETRLEDLEIEIRQNFGNLKDIKEHRVEGTIDADAAMEKIDALKRQIEQIGGIDPEIEKEYIETKERYDFLSGQSHDLTDAIGSLEKVIKELDGIIKERFDKEFKNISAKFEEYFKILFNGGSAKIVKVMTDDGKKTSPEDEEQPVADEKTLVADLKSIKFLQKYNATGLAGIEIQACPPGKKIKSITMLSGGERALTTIALICAIISCNPSPFVVLDEVDAALDEANSERLAKILDDLSLKTQFIAITHNRATMRRANVLYGITMGSDGVSRLLSIKLDEAKEVVKK